MCQSLSTEPLLHIDWSPKQLAIYLDNTGYCWHCQNRSTVFQGRDTIISSLVLNTQRLYFPSSEKPHSCSKSTYSSAGGDMRSPHPKSRRVKHEESTHHESSEPVFGVGGSTILLIKGPIGPCCVSHSIGIGMAPNNSCKIIAPQAE